ncbi:MAG: NUDIX hydrolase [Phenylobacterium sp.]|jgi:8-oxo-dGTP pyrophosphatase MutT (NUDIX family)
MRERLTARVLLFDPDGRILLMKGRLPSGPDAPAAWFTVGGGAEPGEGVLQAAAREIREETGFTDARLGPIVWRREGPLHLANGELVLFKEHYVIAHCTGGEPSREGWDEVERALVDDIRWWALADLRDCAEMVHPIGLVDLLPDILAGRYPAEPREIAWS